MAEIPNCLVKRIRKTKKELLDLLDYYCKLTKLLLKLNSSGVKIDETELLKIKNQLIQNLIYIKKENIVNLEPKFKHLNAVLHRYR